MSITELSQLQFLDFSHNPFLVAFGCLVALIAGFTGLSLTRNLSQKSDGQRKLSIALASVSLGGGIWSMHFVAMLGLQFPILFYYDAAITLASALLAILIVAIALIVLHFAPRTNTAILLSGGWLGIGVLVMHYVGMAGLQLCKAVYTVPGVALSSIVAVLACMLATWVAYRHRNNRNIFLATLCFGIAVASVHFLAMAGTNFVAVPNDGDFGPAMSNEILAIGVIMTSFVIFGACMWVSTTYLGQTQTAATRASQAPTAANAPQAPTPEPTPAPMALQIPCEREGRKVFIAPSEIAFVRADGHYTQIYTDQDRLFCVWPINEATKRLQAVGFVQTHRSYLVNPDKIARFEREKDKGRCTFSTDSLPPVPVSRSKLKEIQDLVGANQGALGAG